MAMKMRTQTHMFLGFRRPWTMPVLIRQHCLSELFSLWNVRGSWNVLLA